MLFALVEGTKRRPMPGFKGRCPTCGEPVLAKCGPINTWHWAHVAGGNCDPWAEPIGAWHLSWQGLLRPDFVEVVKRPHRADIVGVNDIVVELQSSSIDADSVEARESFYGDMVWLFDATRRFRMVRQGQRAFISLGRVKHIQRCKKPVFFDFGEAVIQIERFVERYTIDRVEAYGVVRDRDWMIAEFFGDRIDPNATITPPRVLKDLHRTGGLQEDAGFIAANLNAVAGQDPVIPLSYTWRVGSKREPAALRAIERCPELANGWTAPVLHRIQQLLDAEAMLIDGTIRLVPKGPSFRVHPRAEANAGLLRQIDDHIAAGRMSALDAATRSLIEGRIAQPVVPQPVPVPRPPERTPTLFG